VPNRIGELIVTVRRRDYEKSTEVLNFSPLFGLLTNKPCYEKLLLSTLFVGALR
jgi:hypothetical protein